MILKESHLLSILFVIFIMFCEVRNDNDNVKEHLAINLNGDNDGNNGFDLRNVQTMTFQKNNYTKGNRTDPIPQLNCVGGNACGHSYKVNSVQCKNNGIDENDDVQWKCDTNLPYDLSLGETNLNCEGLTSSMDKIKLKGSCGLEYTLNDKAIHIEPDNSYFTIIITLIILFFIVAICFAVIRSSFIGYHDYDYSYRYGYPLYYGSPYWHNYNYNNGYVQSNFGSGDDYVSASGFGSTFTR